MGLDGISSEVHPTVHVDVTVGTVVEFVTGYPAENGHLIKISGKLSVNNSVQYLVFSTKPGEVDCRSVATCWFALRPQGGEVKNIPIRTGEGGSKTLTELRM